MEQITNALLGLSVLAALACLIYGPWQWVCTDFARQILFEKRDEIFDIAASGRLSFKSSEYRAIRRSLESSIRFAHDLSLPYLLLMAFVRSEASEEKSDLLEAVENIRDDDVRAEIRAKVEEAHRAMVLMVGFKSPLVVLIGLPVTLLGMGAIYFISACRSRALDIVSHWGEIIQVEAELTPSGLKFARVIGNQSRR